MNSVKNFMNDIKSVKLKNCLWQLPGAAILAFGLYNVHSFADITEGGVLGLTLLLHHHFGISPSVSSLVLNFVCYIFGFLVLGGGFVVYSAVAGLGFSLFYAINEQFPPVWAGIADHPLVACVVGAIFVGVGVGICVRFGGAPGGDDALSMGLAKLLKKVDIRWIYLASDLIVLTLSLTYIPVRKIAYSLCTVILSGQIIGFFQKKPQDASGKNGKKEAAKETEHAE